MPTADRVSPHPPRVLVVDDDAANVKLLEALMHAGGYEVVSTMDGLEALDRVAAVAPDLILLDVMMPGCDGFAICRRLKQQIDTRLVPIILLTSLSEPENRLLGIEAGADDFLTKPVSAAELQARVRSLLRLKAFTDELEHAEVVLHILALTLDARNRYTAGHSKRVAAAATALAEHLGLPDGEVRWVARGAFLHDLGKVGIPDAVLLKPGPLSPEERTVVEQHPVIGADLVRPLKTLQRLAPIVRHHHERWDGSGYPDGLSGEAIPLGAQLVGIVDVYEALITSRPYRPALPPPRASRILREETAQGRWHRELVEAFLALREERRQERPCPAGPWREAAGGRVART